MMAARLSPVEGDWLIIPVPLHPRRLWSRGFNQSVLLAREIAKTREARMLVDGLVRRKNSASLGGLGRKARSRELSGAIAPHPARTGQLRGRNIILVDDVLTSGATSNACVAALKRAGADKVIIACFARVLDEALLSRPNIDAI
jgi:ComF family protein